MISEAKILDVKAQLSVLLNLPKEEKESKISSVFDVSLSSARRYIRLAEAYDDPPEAPKILLLDIETSPLEVYAWGIGSKVSLGHYQIKHEWFIISWAAKWLLADGVFGDCVTPKEALSKDDDRICHSLWDCIEEAHIVVAHNAKSFDVRKINARFIANGLSPPSSYQVVDTLLHSRKIAAFSSHKLDHLTQTFGLSQKDSTDFSLWVRCCNGDKEALDYMYKYNKSDIRALEGLYLYLRPWMSSHPSMGLYCDHVGSVCPHCMSESLDWSINPYYTPAGKFSAFRCKKCGAIGRSRFSTMAPGRNRNLVVSTAR